MKASQHTGQIWACSSSGWVAHFKGCLQVKAPTTERASERWRRPWPCWSLTGHVNGCLHSRLIAPWQVVPGSPLLRKINEESSLDSQNIQRVVGSVWINIFCSNIEKRNDQKRIDLGQFRVILFPTKPSPWKIFEQILFITNQPTILQIFRYFLLHSEVIIKRILDIMSILSYML